MLTKKALLRYERQLLIEGLGAKGQEKTLTASTVGI